ncbi:MAG: MarR family transcriptional regulator [Dermatophilaceae bacterium]
MANVEHPGAEFVERFADALVIAGVPRMPARVLALLTATDDARLTASELGEALHASPAAISGAVRYLEQVNLVRRTRHRGSRRDHFVLEGDIWYQNIVGRMGLKAIPIAATLRPRMMRTTTLRRSRRA